MKFIHLLVFLFSIQGFSIACECGEFKTAISELSSANTVFLGTVTSIQRIERPPDTPGFYPINKVTFSTSHLWKDDFKNRSEIIVYTGVDSAACGFDFRPGSRYLVYSCLFEDKLHTSICDRTFELIKGIKLSHSVYRNEFDFLNSNCKNRLDYYQKQ
jgi:hypothetical protein